MGQSNEMEVSRRDFVRASTVRPAFITAEVRMMRRKLTEKSISVRHEKSAKANSSTSKSPKQSIMTFSATLYYKLPTKNHIKERYA